MTYQELKQRQSAMWGNGPYQRVTETLTRLPRNGYRTPEQLRSALDPARLEACFG